MNEALLWGTLTLSAGSIIALIKFWVDIGKAWQRMDDGAEARALIAAKQDLLSSQLSDFKLDVAKTYATSKALTEAETTLATGLRDAVQGVYQRLDNMTQRLDNLLTLARHHDSK